MPVVTGVSLLLTPVTGGGADGRPVRFGARFPKPSAPVALSREQPLAGTHHVLTRAWRSPPERRLDEKQESPSETRRQRYEARAVDVGLVVDAGESDSTERFPASGR